MWKVGAYASPDGARRYVSFERVWRRAERGGGGLRERSRSYVLFGACRSVLLCGESLRVRVMRIGEGVTSLERGEWDGAGAEVSVAFAKYKVLVTDSHYSARHALIKLSLAPIGSFASLQYEVRPSFVHSSGAFASEMTPSLASFNRSK